MAGMLKGRRKKRLVLDIGSSAIRLCEITQTKTGYQLSKYFQREYSSDPQLSAEESKAQRTAALNAVLKEAKVKTKKTIFGVPGQSVFTRTRALPPVPEYKVTQIVRYEIQQQIPFSLDQIAMDYQVLDRTDAGGYEVMMAAIKVDVVEKHLDILNDAKRSIDIVDVSPMAAYNWLKYTGEFGDQGDCVALIDLGATTTDIVIERENQFRFTRPLNVGGNDITRAIGAAFGLNFSDAEKLKRQKGFAPTGDPERDGKGGEVIGQALQRVVSEIMRSFAFFRSLPGGGIVNRVVLTGGGACLRNIVPYLQRQLGVEVRIAQPLSGLAIDPSAQAVNDAPEQASVALGLALRCCERVPIELNLIPPRVLEASRRREQAFYWALVFTTIALIMASVVPVKANENKMVREHREKLLQTMQLYDSELASAARSGASLPASEVQQRYTQIKNRLNGIAKTVKGLDTARMQRMFWLDELEMINDARTGKQVWFSDIETTQVKKRPQSQSGGRGGRGGGGMDMMGMMGMGMPGMGGMGGMGGMDDGTGVDSSGFPGISGRGAGGMMGGGGEGGEGGMNMMSMMMPGMGGMGGMGGGGRDEAAAPTIKRPNAMMLIGYADSNATIREFVDELKKQSRKGDTGYQISVKEVHFNEAAVERVSKSALQNARTTGSSSMGSGMGGGGMLGAGMMGGMMGMPGMGGGMGGGMGMGGTTAAVGQYQVQSREDAILSFTAYVEFDLGYKVVQEAAQTGMMGGGMMGGMPGMMGMFPGMMGGGAGGAGGVNPMMPMMPTPAGGQGQDAGGGQ